MHCSAGATPTGVGLYRHVVGLLFTSGVTKLINEYQPVPFGHADAMVMEWFILAFIGLQCFSSRRLSRYELRTCTCVAAPLAQFGPAGTALRAGGRVGLGQTD